jgi:dipeptidyl aminopeptidase/acylaminoacyl peptidase
VYEQVSRVEPDCGGRYPGYSPSAWSPPGWAVDFDAKPYFVSEYDDVRIASRDPGIELHGWWLPSARPDAPVVIDLHGLGACVRHPEVLAPAGMLHRLGYGVLLIDLRDHGASTIEDGRMAGGTEEYRDVMGAVDWLIEGGAVPGRIGLLGASMGAATAIISGGQDDRVAAVWADSSFADIERRTAEELEAKGFPGILAPAATLVARLVSGDDFNSHTVVGEVANLAGRDLFIVHGELDEATYVSHAYDLVEAAREAGTDVGEWIVPDAGHVAAMFIDPEAYQRRLAGFFGSAFE